MKLLLKNSFVPLSIMLCFTLFHLLACAAQKPAVVEKVVHKLPPVQREFRAAWIASVANINWPSKAGLTTEEQKAEAIEWLDLLKDHNLNAAILQIRPQSDALYDSELEPWSYFLSGQQGKAPVPYYDPLQFWIEQAHNRGIELHAWLNPYRAHHADGAEVTEASIVKTRPQLAVKLKGGYYWLDPSIQETQDHSYNVVMDIVKRYDIDAIHFDDYFYPYPDYNNFEDFPDHESWQAYIEKGGILTRADWRRAAVNNFIKRVYEGIKKQKNHVKFGLSPFGIWRPHHPESIRGFDQYDKLYADARLWLNEGWIDYWTPQLYWPVNKIPQSFPVLLGWWKQENTKKRHFWPGISTGRLSGEKGIDETINQIMITRGMLPESPGIVHWSINTLSNDTLANALSQGPYQQQALVPATPWLDNKAPQQPRTTFEIAGDSLNIDWTHENNRDVFLWILYYKYANSWRYKILDHQQGSVTLPLFIVKKKAGQTGQDTVIQIPDSLSEAAVSAVDRLGNESAPAFIAVPVQEGQVFK